MPATLNPGLLALRPRQVVLLSNQDQKQKMNHKALNSEQKSLLLHSVARFLNRNGFSKTLKKFRSESQIQIDARKDSLLDLEDLYIKYIEMCDGTKTNSKGHQKEQDKQVFSNEGKKLEALAEETGKNNKEKKKKKNKLITESDSQPNTAEEKIVDATLEGENGTDSEMQKKKSRDKEKKKKLSIHDSLIDSVDSGALNSAAVDTNDTPVEEKSCRSKTKKKKKNDSKEITVNGSAEDDSKTSDAHASWEDNKGPKKRKRLDSDENDLKPTATKATEESKSRKTEGMVENGNINSAEKSSAQKLAKEQRNGSAEPKTVKAFQRVKVEEVEFTDERLKDNSYWAKGGAEIGYGAKAQEVLGQVRGRDFRHEKTKKKRGSYRGGQIDLQSHSVKFNYYDDE